MKKLIILFVIITSVIQVSNAQQSWNSEEKNRLFNLSADLTIVNYLGASFSSPGLCIEPTFNLNKNLSAGVSGNGSFYMLGTSIGIESERNSLSTPATLAGDVGVFVDYAIRDKWRLNPVFGLGVTYGGYSLNVYPIDSTLIQGEDHKIKVNQDENIHVISSAICLSHRIGLQYKYIKAKMILDIPLSKKVKKSGTGNLMNENFYPPLAIKLNIGFMLWANYWK